MHLSTLLSTLGLAAQTLAVALISDKDVNKMTLAESDAVVTDFLSKLERGTQQALLHEITGPEAGADVSSVPDRPLDRRTGSFCFSSC